MTTNQGGHTGFQRSIVEFNTKTHPELLLMLSRQLNFTRQVCLPTTEKSNSSLERWKSSALRLLHVVVFVRFSLSCQSDRRVAAMATVAVGEGGGQEETR